MQGTPQPCGNPSKPFKKCLNQILIKWWQIQVRSEVKLCFRCDNLPHQPNNCPQHQPRLTGGHASHRFISPSPACFNPKRRARCARRNQRQTQRHCAGASIQWSSFKTNLLMTCKANFWSNGMILREISRHFKGGEWKTPRTQQSAWGTDQKACGRI